METLLPLSSVRRRPMKRPLLIIAICLLLGAVLNVAVAWGCVRSGADNL